jgi:hypothetical protein
MLTHLICHQDSKYWVLKHRNEKKVSVETTSGMRGRRIKKNVGGREFKCDVFDILKEHL